MVCRRKAIEGCKRRFGRTDGLEVSLGWRISEISAKSPENGFENRDLGGRIKDPGFESATLGSLFFAPCRKVSGTITVKFRDCLKYLLSYFMRSGLKQLRT